MGLGSRRGKLPEEIVGSGVIEQIEPLFLTVVELHTGPISYASRNEQKEKKTDQRCAGHQQAREERPNGALLRSIG